MFGYFFGAGDRGRTGTVSLPPDFESGTSANSITPANIQFKQQGYYTLKYQFVNINYATAFYYYADSIVFVNKKAAAPGNGFSLNLIMPFGPLFFSQPLRPFLPGAFRLLYRRAWVLSCRPYLLHPKE